MNALRDNLGKLIDDGLPSIIGRPRRICLLDPPGHPNVGDSAILLGELDYLARMNPGTVITFYDVDSYSDRAVENVRRADVLLIHGGGNFGDIWMHHHNVRLWALREFSDKRIVQLPQSVHFSNDDARKETAAAIARQTDFTLLVRDQRSLAYARNKFDCVVRLLPDMAFAMGPIARPKPRSHYFCLLRTDKEAVADHGAIERAVRQTGRSFEIADWLEETPTITARADRFFGKVVRRAPEAMSPFASSLLAFRRKYAEERLAVGIDLLSRGRVVVTDRLHAHIMCCLLGIPNIVFDSYDGKISALFDTWTHRAGNARVCEDISLLPQLLEEMDAV